ncbi:hypothetical protein HY500_00105 [Candidatus Woesearchaeota archaeon]|nr:hypothetical protein [Candidatus Woesearchaeota archaeon]
MNYNLYRWIVQFKTPEQARAARNSLAELLGYPLEKEGEIVEMDRGDLLVIEIAKWQTIDLQVGYASQNGSPLLRKIRKQLGSPDESDVIMEDIVRRFM